VEEGRVVLGQRGAGAAVGGEDGGDAGAARAHGGEGKGAGDGLDALDVGVADQLQGDGHVTAVLDKAVGLGHVAHVQLVVGAFFEDGGQVGDAADDRPLHILHGAVVGGRVGNLLVPAPEGEGAELLDDDLIHGVGGEIR